MKFSDAIKTLLIFLIIWLVFSYSFTPIRSSNDVWWQLKAGKYIIEHSFRLPENDVFTYTGEHTRWINHEWLAQIIMYGIYLCGDGLDLGGLRTVIAFKTLLLIATFLIVFLTAYQRSRSFYISALFTLIAAAVARRTFFPRPPVFTYLFFALFILTLYLHRAGRLKTLPLFFLSTVMMLFWVNIHGGFVLAFIVLFFYIIDSLFSPSLRTTDIHHRRSLTKTLIILFIAIFVVSLINPYGIHPHFLTFKVMGAKGLARIIPELQSPNFYYTLAYKWMLIIFMAGFAIIKRRIPSLFELLMLIFFFHESIHHIRHLPLFAIATTPLAAWLVSACLEEFRVPSWLAKSTVVIIAIIFVGYGVTHHREGESYIERNIQLLSGMEYKKLNYPAEACDFILANKFHGNMYNQINYAGYLIWRLSPEHHKVFTDSRFDIWADRFVWEEKAIEAGLERHPQGQNWYELVEKYKINFMVITRDAPLNRVLENNPDWVLVYYWIDPRAYTQYDGWNIYVKNTPENQALIQRCNRKFENLLKLRQSNNGR